MGSVTSLTGQQIGDLVRAAIPDARVSVGGDGYHVDVAVVSDAFAGLRAVQRQQRVYAALSEVIRSGALHAVNISARTVAEDAAASPERPA
jgi:acid stress-induced BolA-like protein IbaG/YrbA